MYSIGDSAGKAADISNAIRTGYDTACQLSNKNLVLFVGQKRLWALLTHFFYPLRQSRQGFASPSQALPRQLPQRESGHARKLYGLAGNCTATA